MNRGVIFLLVLLVAVTVGSVAFLTQIRPPSKAQPLKKLIPPPPPQPVTFYRWSGPDGVVQLSSTPPPAGTPFETISVDGKLNTVPAVEVPPEMAPPADGGPGLPTKAPLPLNPYTPDGIKAMVDQAKQAAEGLKAQQEAQQRMLE